MRGHGTADLPSAGAGHGRHEVTDCRPALHLSLLSARPTELRTLHGPADWQAGQNLARIISSACRQLSWHGDAPCSLASDRASWEDEEKHVDRTKLFDQRNALKLGMKGGTFASSIHYVPITCRMRSIISHWEFTASIFRVSQFVVPEGGRCPSGGPPM